MTDGGSRGDVHRSPVDASTLVASYYTLSGAPVGHPSRFSFEARVAAAARAGFAGVGLLSDDYAAMRAAGRTDADLRRVLDVHGVKVMEVEFLYNWCLPDPSSAAPARELEATLHAMTDAFAPHHLSCGDLSSPGAEPAADVVAEGFAGVCDRAAEHGTKVALEFLPWTAIPNLRRAWDVVRAAGRPNGGVLIDAWHYFRGGPDEVLLRSLPGSAVVGVQLDDAAATPQGPSMEDTIVRRRLPGEGAFDLTALIRTLDAIGVDAPFSVEVISTEQQARPVLDAARRAHDTTQAVLHQARAAGGC
jgi:sugar phosphate isomerase/epimerase